MWWQMMRDAKAYTVPIAAVVGGTLSVLWWPLAAWLPMWARVVCSITAVVFGLWISRRAVDVWANKQLAKTWKCPTCGGPLRTETVDESSDSAAGAGKIVRQFSSVSYEVCKKCGYRRKLDA